MHEHTISCKMILSEGPELLGSDKTPGHAAEFIRGLIGNAESSSLPFVAVSEKQLGWWLRISPSARRAAT